MRTTWRAFTDYWITVMRDEPMSLISFVRFDNGKTMGLMADPKQLREMAADFTKVADIIEKRAAPESEGT